MTTYTTTQSITAYVDILLFICYKCSSTSFIFYNFFPLAHRGDLKTANSQRVLARSTQRFFRSEYNITGFVLYLYGNKIQNQTNAYFRLFRFFQDANHSSTSCKINLWQFIASIVLIFYYFNQHIMIVLKMNHVSIIQVLDLHLF